MKPGDKLWRTFVAVGKVLSKDDLKNFGKALFLGTGFKNLGKGARRTVEAMAVKIPTSSPAQIYVAVASQSWGYGDLRQIGEAISEGWIFRQLSQSNRDRIDRAASEIEWPAEGPRPGLAPSPYPEEKPKLVDPFESGEKKKEPESRAVAAGAALALILLVGVMI